MLRSTVRVLLWVAMLGGSAFAGVKNETLGAQRFKGEIVVSASPEDVWAVITDTRKVGEVLQYQYLSGATTFTSLGDHARFKVWGDEGTLFLVYATPGKELRVSWVPDNGSYLCQERWTLTREGDGTKITYESRYTESGAQSDEELARQVKGSEKMLKRLKKTVEG
jgi:uncharacterized protein YndB with AHSA1/START domain